MRHQHGRALVDVLGQAQVLTDDLAGATARGLRYDKGTLSLDLALSNNESNKSLEAKLGGPGVRVQVDRVNSTGTENTASIRVSAGR